MDPKIITDGVSSETETPATSRKKIFMAVLGNVGSGKTTTVELLVDRYDIPTEPEPVKEWRKMGILKAFYEDISAEGEERGKNRMAYEFQTMVLSTRLASYKKLNWANDRYSVVDGHILSDKFVFADKLHADRLMNDDEKRWYDYHYLTLGKLVPRWEPDAIVYLNTDTKTCMDRIRERNRREEVGITIDYLTSLDVRYKNMIGMPEISDKVFEIDGSQTPDAIVQEIHQRILA